MITVIFSKDRANQLNNCIRTYLEHVKVGSQKTYVIYKASNKDFQRGYDKCIKRYPNVMFMREKDFKQDLISIFDWEFRKEQYVMFLVDDIHFMNNISQTDVQFDYLEHPEMVAISSRLSRNINYCYALNSDVKVPNFTKGCVWDWRREQGDWAYPMSVDGNIYKIEAIDAFIWYHSYTNPNSFEVALTLGTSTVAYKNKNLLCCYPEAPRLVNIPMNRVQNQFPNRCGKREELTAEKLNAMFLDGQEIAGFGDEDLNQIDRPDRIGVHRELAPIFTS